MYVFMIGISITLLKLPIFHPDASIGVLEITVFVFLVSPTQQFAYWAK